MKRVIVICCVLMCFGGVQLVQAQSLKDILNSSKVKDVVNLVTGNVIKFSDLQGTWNYVEPACKMTSGDLLKEASGSLVTSALEKKMVNIYTKLGIVPGNFSYTFSSDSTFTNTIGKKVLKGTYSLDEENTSVDITLYVGKNDHGEKCGSTIGKIGGTGVVALRYGKTYELCQCIILCLEEIR